MVSAMALPLKLNKLIKGITIIRLESIVWINHSETGILFLFKVASINIEKGSVKK